MLLRQAWRLISIAWTLTCIWIVITANPGKHVSSDENLWFMSVAYLPWIFGWAVRVIWWRVIYPRFY